MTAQIKHPYVAPHLTKTSRGNVAACCDKPAEDHMPWADGVPVRLLLKHDVRSGSHLLRKGQIVFAKRDITPGFAEVRPSRWGTNELGQFAELDRGEYAMPPIPGYEIPLEERYSVSSPVKWGREV